jgi:hypothetical protein
LAVIFSSGHLPMMVTAHGGCMSIPPVILSSFDPCRFWNIRTSYEKAGNQILTIIILNR